MGKMDDDLRDADRAGGWALKWFFIAFLAVGLVSILTWAYFVVWSPVKGQGDARIDKYSAENWTKAQAEFHQLYQGIQADDRMINTTATDLARSPGDARLETNLSGLKNHCEGLVANYNTKALSYKSEDFRDAALPVQIDPTNPLTDCKEN